MIGLHFRPLRRNSTRRFGAAGNRIFTILALLAAATLGSCSAVRGLHALLGGSVRIKVAVQPAANDEYPLAMTVLYVYDEETFNKLLGLSAQQWFEGRAQIEESYHDRGAIEAFDWEWVTGADTTVRIPYRATAVGAIVFANYFKEGLHRTRVEPRTDLNVVLDFDEMRVTELE
jgi:hypothetical protein